MTTVSGGRDQGQEGNTVRWLPAASPWPHPGICSIHSPGRERRVRTRGEESRTTGEVMLPRSPSRPGGRGMSLLVTDP